MKLDEIINNSKASQDKSEVLWMYKQVIKILPKIIVEIGSWHGDNLVLLRDIFYPIFICGIESDENIFKKENKDKMHCIFGDSHNEQTLNQLTDKLKGRQIDYLFIDGDHTYEGVKKDFEMYAPLVRDGGIVGFHDVALEGENADGHEWWELGLQVKKYYDELCKIYPHQEFRGSDLATGIGLIHL